MVDIDKTYAYYDLRALNSYFVIIFYEELFKFIILLYDYELLLERYLFVLLGINKSGKSGKSGVGIVT